MCICVVDHLWACTPTHVDDMCERSSPLQSNCICMAQIHHQNKERAGLCAIRRHWIWPCPQHTLRSKKNNTWVQPNTQINTHTARRAYKQCGTYQFSSATDEDVCKHGIRVSRTQVRAGNGIAPFVYFLLCACGRTSGKTADGGWCGKVERIRYEKPTNKRW